MAASPAGSSARCGCVAMASLRLASAQSASSSSGDSSSSGRGEAFSISLEALAKAQIAAAQRHLGIYAQVPAEIHHGKQQVAQFGFDGGLARRVVGRGFRFQFRWSPRPAWAADRASRASRNRPWQLLSRAWPPQPARAWRAVRCRVLNGASDVSGLTSALGASPLL